MIRNVDKQDDATLHQVHAVIEHAHALDRPWFEPMPYAEWVAQVRHEDPSELSEIVAAYDGDRLVGVSERWMPLEDNTSMLWSTVSVDPDQRRRGFGSELTKADVARARELGRTQVLAEFHVPGDDLEGHPYYLFALAQGYEPGWVENVRHLQLPVDSALLERHDALAAEKTQGYDIRVYVGRVPDEYLPGMCELIGQLAVDAPSGVIEFEEESVTPERMRKWYDLEKSIGRTRLSALAIHRETNTVAAQSDLIVTAPPSKQVWQWGTFVHREHRGHRLGMAVKVANLKHLQREFPGRSLVNTSNADTNAYMVSINEELGFELVERSPAMRITLT